MKNDNTFFKENKRDKSLVYAIATSKHEKTSMKIRTISLFDSKKD
jgi:hypothetical protein